MTLKKKIFGLGFVSLKLFVGTISSFAVGSAQTAHATAAPATTSGPATAQRAQVDLLVQGIVNNAQGRVNAANVSQAIEATVAQYHSATADEWAAAINRLNLSGNTLSMAVNALGDTLDTSTPDIVSSLIANTYATQGPGTARAQVAHLRDTLGSSVVDTALDQEIQAMNNGHDTPDDDSDGLYNG